MQTPEHVERVAAEAVVDLAADGVVYAEVRFAPELHEAMAPQAAVEAVAAGFRRGERDAAAAGRPISAWVICCAMRTADRSLEIARLVDAMRDRRAEGGGVRPRRRRDRVPALDARRGARRSPASTTST